MAISFTAIPVNLRVPGAYLEFDNSQAVTGLSILPARILVLGQKLAAGASAALVPTRILSAEAARTLYGRGSQLARMLTAMKAADGFSEIWALPYADLAGGAAATGTITITGTATAAGTLALLIAGERVQVGVTAGMTAAQVATATVAAIGAAPDLPVTAAAAAAVVTLTARHKGLCGNDIDARVNYYDGDATPAGLTVAIVAMAGGTGNPDATAGFAIIGDEWYTDWVIPWTDAANLAAVKTEMASRWGPLRMIEGRAWAAAGGSHAALSTLGETQNNPWLRLFGLKGSPTEPCVRAAIQCVVGAASLAIDPARPLQTLALPGVLAPVQADRFTLPERNLLLYSGIATERVSQDGTVSIERAITTYRETSTGADDPSYLDTETIATLTFLRYDVRTFVPRKYPRHKLADDGTRFGPGQKVMTPKLMKAELIARFSLWEEAGLVEDFDTFKVKLIVERDGSDRDRLNALIPPDIINGFRVFAGLVQFTL